MGRSATGSAPRLEALDVLSVLRREPDAPVDLREKSLYLAARTLELVGAGPQRPGLPGGSDRARTAAVPSARSSASSTPRGRRELPAEAPCLAIVTAPRDGRIRSFDCWRAARIAKLAGAPAHPSRWTAAPASDRRRGEAGRTALRDPRAERVPAGVRPGYGGEPGSGDLRFLRGEPLYEFLDWEASDVMSKPGNGRTVRDARRSRSAPRRGWLRSPADRRPGGAAPGRGELARRSAGLRLSRGRHPSAFSTR